MDLRYFGTEENARAFAEEATDEGHHRTFRFWSGNAWRTVQAFDGGRTRVTVLDSTIEVAGDGEIVGEEIFVTIPLAALVAMDVDDPGRYLEIQPCIFVSRPVARWIREPDNGFMVRFIPEATGEFGQPRPRAGIPGKP